MYKIKVLNRLSTDAIHAFDSELVATSDDTSLHQIKKIKKN